MQKKSRYYEQQHAIWYLGRLRLLVGAIVDEVHMDRLEQAIGTLGERLELVEVPALANVVAVRVGCRRVVLAATDPHGGWVGRSHRGRRSKFVWTNVQRAVHGRDELVSNGTYRTEAKSI